MLACTHGEKQITRAEDTDFFKRWRQYERMTASTFSFSCFHQGQKNIRNNGPWGLGNQNSYHLLYSSSRTYKVHAAGSSAASFFLFEPHPSEQIKTSSQNIFSPQTRWEACRRVAWFAQKADWFVQSIRHTLFISGQHVWQIEKRIFFHHSCREICKIK